MAQQNINLGSAPNDGTGTKLRAGGQLINDNFTELYAVSGWGVYTDDVSSNISVSTTPVKFTVNNLGANSNSNYLPREIRGTSELWDSSTNKLTPITLGDSYDLRLDFEISSKAGSPTILDLVLDIGVGASPTIPIVNRAISLAKTPPYILSIGFPIFCLSTFLTNGGQFFLNTDSGSVSISARSIFIKRDFKGDL